ncbi:MAG TPA: WD40 repeat domain-containing protein, partial [Polyangiaceae bacterium]
TWQEQVLTIPGSVLSYAWSPGARFLAAAYSDSAGSTWLGGVDATSADTVFANQTAIPSLSAVRVMDSTHAKLNSELLWLESNTLVAFHGDEQTSDISVQEGPYFVAFNGAGFGAVTDFGIGYDQPLDLEPAQGGIFAIAGTPAQRSLDFWNYSGDAADFYLKGPLQSAVADPEGRYVAYPLHGQLEVAFTSQSGGTSDPPTLWNLSRNSSLDMSCGSILAWNPKSQQLVCDAQVGSPATGEVRLYDLDAGTKSAMKLPLSQLTGYHQGDAGARRRTFSPQADLFAFTTRDGAFVANDISAQVEFDMTLPPLASRDQPGELAFAPDQSVLLWLSGTALGAMALEKNGYQVWVDGLLAPPACAEEFVSAPRTWCGRSSPATALAWSPSSRFAAAMSTTHGVRVFDFSEFAQAKLQWSDDACATNCNSDFVFQP